MTDLADARFRGNVQILAASLLRSCEARGIDMGDASNVIGAALTEVLATYLGPVDAIERLRMLADLLERQIMDRGLTGIQ